jgi:hypothetical protein
MDEGKKCETIGFRDKRQRDAYRRLAIHRGGGAVASVPAGTSPFATSVRAGEGRTK